MIIMLGIMVVRGRHGTGRVIKNLHPSPQAEGRVTLGLVWVLETLKLTPSDTASSRSPHFLILPMQATN